MFGYGSTALGGMPLTRHSDTEFRVIVNGADWTSKILAESLQVQDSISSRSTAKFEARDDAFTWHPTPGESIHVIYHGDRIFGGQLEEVEEKTQNTSKTNFLSFNCADFTSIADRYYVAAVYESTTLLEIIQDILDNQTKMAEDGVTISEVVNGSLDVEKISFNYKKASDCFRDLADMFGLSWTIDAYRKLIFFDTSTYRAPFDVGDLNPIHRDLTFTRTRRSYRNRQILRAGKERTDTLTESFFGDSSVVAPEKRKRSFTLSYPIAEISSRGVAAPLDLWVRRVGGSVPGVQGFQRVGIQGVDKDSDLTIANWKQWFYKVDEDKLTQNSAQDQVQNPTLEPSEYLEIKYRGYYPIIVDLENDDEMATRRGIEGGSGEYQQVEDDESIDGLTLANQKAQSLIERYGRIPNLIRYEVDQFGLFAGHLQTCRFSEHGIASDRQWLVDDISISFHCGPSSSPIIRCTVSALDGERQDGWSDFFRDLYNAGRKFISRENEKISVSRNIIENATLADSLTDSVNGSVTLHSYTEDPFTCAMVGLFATGEWPTVTEYGWHVGRSKIGKPYGS